MTTPSGHNYDITVGDADKIGDAITPKMQLAWRKDLKSQTEEIGESTTKIITHHQEDMRNIVHQHEEKDAREFGEIKQRLGEGDKWMRKIDMKIAYAAGFIAAVPIIWDLIKTHFLK